MDWEAAYSFWDWSDDRMGLFHIYAALAALLLGPFIFLRRKGDFLHRLTGLGFVFAMLTTNATALVIYDFTGGINFFHFAAAVSLATSLAGLAAILVYAANRAKAALSVHIELMAWSYFGLVLAAGAEAWTRGFGPQISNLAAFWAVFAVFMLIAGGIGNILTVRLIRSVKRRWIEGD